MLEKTLKKLFFHLTRYKIIIILIMAILLAFFLFQTSKLKVDNSIKVWFTDNDPALLSYYSFLEKFGSDEVVITVINDTLAYFDSLRIQKSIELHHKIENIDGVAIVRSIINAPLSYSSKTSKLENVFSKGYTEDKIAYIKKKLGESKINSRYIGKNNNVLIFYSWMVNSSNLDAKRGIILDKINDYAKESLISESATIHMGGTGVLFNALNQSTIKEGAVLISISYLLLIACVFVATRSSIITFFTILVVSMASITMFGFMGLLGRSVNMVSLALPPLIMVMGVSNMIHITYHLRFTCKNKGVKHFIYINSLAIISIPILFNALTTAGGFFSLNTASMAITRDYGLFAAIGIISVFVYSILASLFIGQKFIQKRNQKKTLLFFSYFVEKIFVFSIRYRAWVISTLIIVVIALIVGINKIEVDTFTLDFLSEKHIVRQDNIIIMNNIGAYIPLEFVIELKNKSWKDKSVINNLLDLQKKLEQEEKISSSFSIASLIFEANRRLPLSQNKIILIASELQKEKSFNELVADKGKTIRLTINVSMSSAKEFEKITNRVLDIAAPIIGDDAKMKKSGYLPLYSSIINQTLTDQIASLSLAFIIIIMFILIILKSLKFTLLAIPSNLLPVLFVLAFMGFSDIRLDIATITVAAAVFGIIVDDSIHILYNLKGFINEGLNINEALKRVAQKTGSAIVTTSIILVVGYSSVTLANVTLISNIGVLMIMAIFFALFTDLLLLPALASFYFKDKRKANA